MLNTSSRDATRQRAIAWASAIVRDGQAVVLDTETTGLGPDSEIVDIGVVGIDGTVYLDCLVKPERPIPVAATEVHGITNEMVAGAEPWPLVYERLCESLAGTVLVYNLEYDLKVINQVSRRHGLPEFRQGTQWQCAMNAYSEFDGTIGQFGSLKWHRLEHAAAAMGITPGGHRALADAEATRQLIHAMAAQPG